MAGRVRNPHRQLAAHLRWGIGRGAGVRCCRNTAAGLQDDPHQSGPGAEEGVADAAVAAMQNEFWRESCYWKMDLSRLFYENTPLQTDLSGSSCICCSHRAAGNMLQGIGAGAPGSTAVPAASAVPGIRSGQADGYSSRQHKNFPFRFLENI